MSDQTEDHDPYQTVIDRNITAEILDHCEKLASLLREPEYGLLTWQEFRAQRAAALYNALAEVVDVSLVDEAAHARVGLELAERREHAGGQVVDQ